MHTFIIENALICDGFSPEPYSGSAVFEDGMIKSAGEKPVGISGKSFDASGLCLAPGFIDPHSHSDISILAAPLAEAKISQGVTTEITGNCGLSVFPVTDMNREHLEELYRNYDEKISWKNIGDYAREVSGRKPAVNIASLCGHNTLRAAVKGYGKSSCSSDDNSRIASLLHESLDSGACGLSTGLLYIPGKFADSAELLELMKALAVKNKVYTSHLRNEGDTLIESIRETVENAIAAGQKNIHISHLKTAGRRNWNKLEEALGLIRSARERGLELSADRYPYTESMTQLCIIVPPPFDDMDSSALEKFLKSSANREKFLERAFQLPPERWETSILLSSSFEKIIPFKGKTLAGSAMGLGIPPAELFTQIMENDASGTMAAFSGSMNPENMRRILRQPFVCCCSDETSRPADSSLGTSHPRAYGSFARYLEMFRDELGLAEAIRKITSFPASIFKLKGRGRTAPGFAADLTLFDPAEIHAKADFADPHALCRGIKKVWVNGALTYDEGKIISGNGSFL